MTGFRGGAAIASGFRLVGREPLAVAAWAGVYVVLGGLPQVLVWAKMWPAFSVLLAQKPGMEAGSAALADLQAQMGAIQPLIWLCTVLMLMILYGAIYRAILEPENRRWFYLRLGMQEVWMLLSSLVVLTLAFIAILVLAIPIAIVSAGMGHGPASGLLKFLLVAAGVFAFFWLALRFAMVTPMAWAHRRFVLMESWRMTRGKGLKMVGVAFALLGIVIGAELVLGGAFLLAFYPTISGGEAGIAKMLGDPSTLLARWGPWMVIGGVVSALLAAAAYAVMAAPWASIYSDLSSEAPSGGADA